MGGREGWRGVRRKYGERKEESLGECTRRRRVRNDKKQERKVGRV